MRHAEEWNVRYPDCDLYYCSNHEVSRVIHLHKDKEHNEYDIPGLSERPHEEIFGEGDLLGLLINVICCWHHDWLLKV